MAEVIAGGHFFAQFFSVFRADAVLCARQMAQHAVAGGVAELCGLNVIEGLIDGVKAGGFGNALAFALNGVNGGVQQ